MEIVGLIKPMTYIGLLCCLLSCIIIYKKGLLHIAPWLAVFLYLLLQLFIEIPATELAKRQINNMPLLHLYVFFEFITISLFYMFILTPFNPKWSKYLKALIVVVSVFIILNTVFIQDIYTFNSYAKTLTNVFFLVYSIFYFIVLIQNNNDPLSLSNYESAFILISSAILIYYSASLFAFMTGQIEVINNSPYFIYIWLLNSTANVTMRILIFIAVWKVPQFLLIK